MFSGFRFCAYLAFSLGMTFEVPDGDLKTKQIRATALLSTWSVPSSWPPP
jgi:uncharacterized membrane protein